MKQLLFIILLSVVSVGIGYVVRSQKNEYEVEIQTADVSRSDLPAEPQNVKISSTLRSDFPKEVGPPDMTLSSKTLEQGDTLIVSINHEENAALALKIQDKNTPLIPITPKKSIAIYGIDVRKEPGTLAIFLLRKDAVIQEENVKITKRNFPITQLVLSDTQKTAGVTPEKAATEIVQNDNAKLYEVLDKPLPKIYIKDEFVYPLPELINVGGFGNIRKSGETEIRHLGVDLDAKRGDAVKAIQSGVVRLTRALSNYGNTIVVDHGASIFSMYLHLNSMDVKEGDNISKGQVIGAVGNTGDYSLDPHLHLSIKANGASVDPLRFIKAIEKNLKN